VEPETAHAAPEPGCYRVSRASTAFVTNGEQSVDYTRGDAETTGWVGGWENLSLFPVVLSLTDSIICTLPENINPRDSVRHLLAVAVGLSNDVVYSVAVSSRSIGLCVARRPRSVRATESVERRLAALTRATRRTPATHTPGSRRKQSPHRRHSRTPERSRLSRGRRRRQDTSVKTPVVRRAPRSVACRRVLPSRRPTRPASAPRRGRHKCRQDYITAISPADAGIGGTY
jgi:hypothetical protein